MTAEAHCICTHPSIVHPAGDGCCVDDCACTRYQPGKPKKRPKYRARRTEVDGEKFDSQKEANRWGHLRLLEKAGQLRNLRRQPWWALMAPIIEGGLANINDGRVTGMRIVGQYYADFDYELLERGQWRYIVEDVKGGATGGTRTEMYRWKKKHFEIQYGIQIQEV